MEYLMAKVLIIWEGWNGAYRNNARVAEKKAKLRQSQKNVA